MENIGGFLHSRLGHILLILILAVGAHLIVLVIKKVNNLLHLTLSKKKSKWNSIRTLTTSILIFAVYFIALGIILQEMDVSLTAYLASASVIGLAVGFGTQGTIQDIITGLTIVLSDIMDVGDLVEINGVTGTVKSINMRFIEIEDHLRAKAYIPNRTVSKVVNYPKGYLSCSIDFIVTPVEEKNENMVVDIEKLIKSFKEQYETIFKGSISFYNSRETISGKKYSRIKLRIWPGRGSVIETIFKAEVLNKLKEFNPDYKDWMVNVIYETDKNNGNGSITRNNQKKKKAVKDL